MEPENHSPIVDSMSHRLGVLSGRFESIEESIRDISEAMKTIAGHSARVDLLEQAKVKTEERLTELERENAAMRQILEQAEEKIDRHLDNYVPLETKMGKWAARFIIFIGGLLLKWLFDALPRLMKFLE